MCTAFCTWELNEARSGNVEAIRETKRKAIEHIEFLVSLYRMQVYAGRCVLHAHPANATSWQLGVIQDLLAVPSVHGVYTDQCQFGAEVMRGSRRGSPVKKPTGFMTNSACVAQTLDARCSGRHGVCSRAQGGRHSVALGQIAKDAAKYPRRLCQAIPKGTVRHFREDNLLKDGCYGIQAPDDDEAIKADIRGQREDSVDDTRTILKDKS